MREVGRVGYQVLGFEVVLREEDREEGRMEGRKKEERGKRKEEEIRDDVRYLYNCIWLGHPQTPSTTIGLCVPHDTISAVEKDTVGTKVQDLPAHQFIRHTASYAPSSRCPRCQ